MGKLEDFFETKIFLGREVSISINDKIHTGIIYQTEYNPNIYEILEQQKEGIKATKIGRQLKMGTEEIEAKTCGQPIIYNEFSKNYTSYEKRKNFIQSNQERKIQ